MIVRRSPFLNFSGLFLITALFSSVIFAAGKAQFFLFMESMEELQYLHVSDINAAVVVYMCADDNIKILVELKCGAQIRALFSKDVIVYYPDTKKNRKTKRIMVVGKQIQQNNAAYLQGISNKGGSVACGETAIFDSNKSSGWETRKDTDEMYTTLDQFGSEPDSVVFYMIPLVGTKSRIDEGSVPVTNGILKKMMSTKTKSEPLQADIIEIVQESSAASSESRKKTNVQGKAGVLFVPSPVMTRSSSDTNIVGMRRADLPPVPPSRPERQLTSFKAISTLSGSAGEYEPVGGVVRDKANSLESSKKVFPTAAHRSSSACGNRSAEEPDFMRHSSRMTSVSSTTSTSISGNSLSGDTVSRYRFGVKIPENDAASEGEYSSEEDDYETTDDFAGIISCESDVNGFSYYRLSLLNRPGVFQLRPNEEGGVDIIIKGQLSGMFDLSALGIDNRAYKKVQLTPHRNSLSSEGADSAAVPAILVKPPSVPRGGDSTYVNLQEIANDETISDKTTNDKTTKDKMPIPAPRRSSAKKPIT